MRTITSTYVDTALRALGSKLDLVSIGIYKEERLSGGMRARCKRYRERRHAAGGYAARGCAAPIAARDERRVVKDLRGGEDDRPVVVKRHRESGALRVALVSRRAATRSCVTAL